MSSKRNSSMRATRKTDLSHTKSSLKANENAAIVSSQTAGGIAGATIGGMVGGPIGALIGGVAGAVISAPKTAAQVTLDSTVGGPQVKSEVLKKQSSPKKRSQAVAKAAPRKSVKERKTTPRRAKSKSEKPSAS